MTLKELLNELINASNDMLNKGIDPSSVRVTIHHDGREATGDIFNVVAFKNITRDDIPYDVGGMGFSGSDVIKRHEDVIIIFGGY